MRLLHTGKLYFPNKIELCDALLLKWFDLIKTQAKFTWQNTKYLIVWILQGILFLRCTAVGKHVGLKVLFYNIQSYEVLHNHAVICYEDQPSKYNWPLIGLDKTGFTRANIIWQFNTRLVWQTSPSNSNGVGS